MIDGSNAGWSLDEALLLAILLPGWLPRMPGSDLTIMVIDDSVAEVGLLRESIEEECRGVTFHHIPSVQEAIACIGGMTPQQLPDVLVVDYRMPRSSGVEVLRELAKHRQWSTVPCIVMTGSADPAMREECRSAGATEIVVKPSDFSGYLKFARELTARMRASKPEPGP